MNSKRLLLFIIVIVLLAGCAQNAPSGSDGRDAETAPSPSAEAPSDARVPSGRQMRALTVGGVAIAAVEVEYYYHFSYYQMVDFYQSYGMLDWLGIDMGVPLEEQYLDEETTWAEYFEEQAAQTLQYVVILSGQAQRDGVALNDADLAQIDYIMADADEALIRQDYGQGLTLGSYRAILERQFLAVRFQTELIASFDRSEAVLERYYAENRDAYDTIDYNALTLPLIPEEHEHEEGDDHDAYEAEQRAKADEILALVTTAESFDELYHDYIDSFHHDCDGAHSRFTETVVNLTGLTGEYLLGEARGPGDKAVVEEDGFLAVILFNGRTRDESKTINIRHILISAIEGEFAGDTDGARARAGQVYDEWQNGAATEESFAALASEHSADPGSNRGGGLYENVYQGQMVPEFDGWCFDGARKPGDSGVVETQFGFHIMYFAGDNMPMWMLAVKNDMDGAEFDEWLGRQFEANPYEFVSGE